MARHARGAGGIVQDFRKAQAWAEAHECPPFLGESGTYDKADMPSRVRWTRFVARQAEELGLLAV